jgi:lipopolysaccharide/colanic/teichoic acid biosynthesis glycosyltransferase
MYVRLKRGADVLGAFFLLSVLSPLIMVIAIVVRATMGCPVLFRQKRPGLREKSFTVFKFRTMTDERDARGNLLPDQQRSLPLGVFLRRTSLDELPQLWNILRGDLSFVGPRPLLESYIPYYSATERRRHSVRPGLTGWAQVNGRNTVDFDDRLAMDVWYVDHMSFWLDLRILLRTIWAVLTQSGVALEQPMQALDLQRSVRYSDGNSAQAECSNAHRGARSQSM